MSYLVAKQKCGCVATSLFEPLENTDVLAAFIQECMENDYVIETRTDNVLVSAEKCLAHGK